MILFHARIIICMFVVVSCQELRLATSKSNILLSSLINCQRPTTQQHSSKIPRVFHVNSSQFPFGYECSVVAAVNVRPEAITCICSFRLFDCASVLCCFYIILVATLFSACQYAVGSWVCCGKLYIAVSWFVVIFIDWKEYLVYFLRR